MRIEQIMRHDPTRVGPDEPVSRLIEWYANPGNRSRYTYVVDKDGVLVGVVTMLELLGLFLPPELVDSHENGALSEPEVIHKVKDILQTNKSRPVRDLMRTDLPTVRASSFFLDARLLLRGRGVTALPVVDGAGVLVGEVTRRVLIRLLDNILRDPDLFELKKDSKQLFETSSEFFIG
ncbi:MAG: CBS domain-containing protein [Humidesulfovibrio sp.]|uniref:CBS domain-containing protein n=1 Tax=Humidesulfovibrio sp. TaxID=2910988 RepID=UPI0027E8DC9F|nr:CBS domain-containing protein [Humidesulfovibrio sp.]MDQ7835390.1 CBS domain-containing protein [Humidesulfovibrio sp.]